MPSINSFYWLLTALSTQVYLLMYVLMFMAVIKLRYKYPDQARPFKIPGGNIGLWLVSLLGLIACTITLIVGFFPPSGIDVGTKSDYFIMFSSGIFLMIAPCLGFYWYKHINTP
jgi:amino acid transporter